MILVNEHNRVLEGAHRAALLMGADHEEEVEVVRVGVSGKRVADCAVSVLDTGTRRPLNMITSTLLCIAHTLHRLGFMHGGRHNYSNPSWRQPRGKT